MATPGTQFARAYEGGIDSQMRTRLAIRTAALYLIAQQCWPIRWETPSPVMVAPPSEVILMPGHRLSRRGSGA